MSLETMTKIGTYTVGAGGISSFSFSGIPQTYTDLIIKVSARVSGSQAYAEAALYIQFNSDTTAANYKYAQHWGLGSGSVGSNNGSNFFFGNIEGGGMTANVFSTSEVCIPNYSGNSFKTTMWSSTEESSTANATIADGLTKWNNTAPITSITIFSDTNSFVQYSTFTLYGVKSMRAASGNSIKATGGSVKFDGTYVTHTFNTSGTFTPTTNLLLDYLVVAGGGGGGGGTDTGNLRGGGGGGAGGYLTGTKYSALFGNSYAVTIGAGGAAGATATNGTAGSTSSFATSTPTGGGYGGANNAAGGNGGSGGGGAANSASAGLPAGGTGTVGQGNNGNSGVSNNNAGGGGGGSSAGSGFDGGTGYTSTVSGISGTYAGGGGGGTNNLGGNYGSTGGTSGGGGLGAGANRGSGSAGLPNTGGGGGGGYFVSGGSAIAANAGGSGIVIISYKG